MFSTKVRKWLSGIMIAGDILLGSVFFADLLFGYDTEIDLFILAFLAVDALLSIDYISKLTKEEKEEIKKAASRAKAQETRKANADRKLDQEMAQDISSQHEALEYQDMEPDELAELLGSQKSESMQQKR